MSVVSLNAERHLAENFTSSLDKDCAVTARTARHNFVNPFIPPAMLKSPIWGCSCPDRCE